MEIYIDITHYLKFKLNTGIQRVLIEFLKRVINDSKINVYVLCYSNKSFFHIDNKEIFKIMHNHNHTYFKKRKKVSLLAQSTKRRIFLEIDLVWNTNPKRALFYKDLKRYNYLLHNFVYDLIPILKPEFFYKETKKNFPQYINSICKHSQKVYFISQSTKNDFLKIKKNHSNRKIDNEVIYLGSNFHGDKQLHQHKYNSLLKKQYILFVGTIEPRKKQNIVLEVFERLYLSYPELNLVFIGRVGWNTEKFMNYINQHPLKDKNIYHLTDVNNKTLKAFYKKAFLVTYLSSYEGYGLPIAESLYYKNITIVSKNSAIEEIADGFVDYVYSNTSIELEKVIIPYLTNHKHYKNKIKLLEKYKLITWNTFYKQIIKNYI